ncbi:MAG: GTPase HflX [Christensenellaceae bacterium]|jgi:GTP-binding protein HflX
MADREIHGNTDGISNAMLEEMQGMYDMDMPRDIFLSETLAGEMAKYSQAINREISVLVARNGTVRHISIGKFDRVEMPSLSTKRSGRRLSGIRCIHTHPGGSGQLSSVDYATLSSARFDAMAAIGIKDGRPVEIYAAFLTAEDMKFQLVGPLEAGSFGAPGLMQAIWNADRSVGREQTHDLLKTQEYAILVGLKDEGMDELRELAQTAGAKVVAAEVQRRDTPDSVTYIGRGKVDELSLDVISLDADLVIVNAEISPIQQRNLEQRLNVKVVDRTALILDIFAMRAKSKEGCLQVELAQMKYLLPRLIGQGMALSRQVAAAGGMGIAARGPGETKLELDRRHIRRRIHALEQEIKQLEKQRGQRRSKRNESGIPTVALVGYTNAGKSTLLNALTGADAYVEDKLFATLDPLTRRMEIDGREVVVTDTVGFVRDLPHDLVEAFRSTLEEVAYADVLLHVVDGSDPEMRAHMKVVDEVLGTLGAADTPRMIVFNKMDIAKGPVPDGMVAISAKTGQGMDALKKAVADEVAESFKRTTLRLPYSRSDLVSLLHENGTVLSEDYQEEEMVLEVELPAAVLKRVRGELEKSK